MNKKTLNKGTDMVSTKSATVKEEKVVTQLLMGNSAIARGCLEAGVSFVASYPGSPSSEVTEELAVAAKEQNLYVEWSVNEKVAAEAAMAASYSGLRAVSIMKQNGLNVASDFIMNVNTTDTVGGLVFIISDDPSAISSSNEEDSRPFSKWAGLPLLELADFQDAKDVTKWAFELSEELRMITLMRGQTRLNHARSDVKLGDLPELRREAKFVPGSRTGVIVRHEKQLQKLKKAAEIFEVSPFNTYTGPEHPDLLIIVSGVSFLYCTEAVATLGLEKRVGIFKLTTLWPLPKKLIQKQLSRASRVLFVEQTDPFVEDNIIRLYGEFSDHNNPVSFYGKNTGHINAFGELDVDLIIKALCELMGMKYTARDKAYEAKAKAITSKYVVPRDGTLCPGCPHRASFWIMKNALALVGGEGFVNGDIGCYGAGGRAPGYSVCKTMGGMGSGTGMACGFGQLGKMGFKQPVLAVCGDSTFFHAAIPALINAVYNQANFTLLILDNNATAMTGQQPHAGTGKNALDGPAPVIEIENVCRSLGIDVQVADPFDLQETQKKVIRLMEQGGGVRVIIMRRRCELVRGRAAQSQFSKVYVDTQKCLGETCGCNRYCTRVFKCPGIIWNREQGKAQIDEAVCTKCGVCTLICPGSAIIREVA
jgi:indolepyruvate ferredoxin oxidoreductase alpha subunit